jgi:soluble lytic murein transglycosylase-like protein
MGEKIYTDMLDGEYAKMLGNGGQFGLAALIEKELRENEGTSVSTDNLSAPAWMIDNKFLTSSTSQLARTSINYEQLAQRMEQWDALVTRASETYNVDKSLILAVISQESGGNQFAVSRAGAKGLMQLMDTTARQLGVGASFDPEENINAGVKYLRTMLDRYNNDERYALASYNAGPGAVDKYQGIPPYRETQDYVRSVLTLREKFAAMQVADADGGGQLP